MAIAPSLGGDLVTPPTSGGVSVFTLQVTRRAETFQGLIGS
jgi:hypothetical protein